jgi:transcriptional regulator with XRE-family HTH domain
MNSDTPNKDKHLPESVRELLEKTCPTAEALAQLESQHVDLDGDPDFVSDFLKAQFAEDVYRAMAEKGLNKNALSKKLGKTRQYVGRILNESANFTFRTIAEIACALGRQVSVRMIAADERLVVVKSVTQYVRAEDILSSFQAPKHRPLRAYCADYVIEDKYTKAGNSEYERPKIAA